MRFVPIALLLLANALWGSSYVVAKVALEEISPPLLAALRFTLAAAVLWVIVLSRGASMQTSQTRPLRLDSVRQAAPQTRTPRQGPVGREAAPQTQPPRQDPVGREAPPQTQPPRQGPVGREAAPPTQPPRQGPVGREAARSAGPRSNLLPPVRDGLKLLAIGAVGVGANGLLGYWGVSLTTATDAALLIVGEVLFTTLLAVVLSSERLSQLRAIGLLVGIAGVIILVLGGATAAPTPSAPARALGNILILTGLAFESAFTVLGTRLARRYDPLTVLTLSLSGSCVLWLPVIGVSLASGVRLPSTEASLGVLYLALVTSVVCYLVWFSVLRHAGAALGALSLLAQPVVGALLGIMLLGDPLSATTLLGGACVILCLLLASLRSDPVPQTVAEM